MLSCWGNVPYGGAQRSPAPAAGALPRSFGKLSGLKRRIPYIIHGASPGGWVTAGAQRQPCAAERTGRQEAAPARLRRDCRPSTMPDGGLPAAKGATHVPHQKRVQVNLPPGQAAGSGAGRCAGSCLVPARGIVSQGPAGVGA